MHLTLSGLLLEVPPEFPRRRNTGSLVSENTILLGSSVNSDNPPLIDWRKPLCCNSLECCWTFYRPFVVHLIWKPTRSGEGVSWKTEVACTSTPDDEALKNHLIIWRTASASPSKSASTRPSSVFCTQPRKPNSSACRRTRSRKARSCTTSPEMKACERNRCACSSLTSSYSPQESSARACCCCWRTKLTPRTT